MLPFGVVVGAEDVVGSVDVLKKLVNVVINDVIVLSFGVDVLAGVVDGTEDVSGVDVLAGVVDGAEDVLPEDMTEDDRIVADMMIYLCDYSTIRLKLYRHYYEQTAPSGYASDGEYQAQINSLTNNNDMATIWASLTDAEKAEIKALATSAHALTTLLEANYRNYWNLVNKTGEIESSVTWLKIPDALFSYIVNNF